MMIPKNKPVKLHGKALAELNADIHERDGDKCIICGEPVDPGEKFHHEPSGSGRKSDEITKGVTLCKKCHHERHFGKVLEFTRKCVEYLRKLYPWQK